ncbi:MAG: hypothetical protein Q7U78_09165 [Gallionella sp.]|nr:hypothetical protein [Gallionella sp.]
MNIQTRHSGAGRSPAEREFRAADKAGMSSRFVGNHLIDWISACAGMTANEVTA